jgi:hypothetical protein
VLASRKLVASCRCGGEVEFQVVAEKTDAPLSVLVVVVVCLDAGSTVVDFQGIVLVIFLVVMRGSFQMVISVVFQVTVLPFLVSFQFIYIYIYVCVSFICLFVLYCGH